MGNNKSGVEFAINLDKPFYFSSQVVKGHLYVNATKRFPAYKILLEIEGIQTCEFRTFEGQTIKGYKKLLHTKYSLAEFGHNQYLQGQYDFPFSFKFLEYLPGTFQEDKQYKAKVNYTIKASILSKDSKCQKLFKTLSIIIRQPQRDGQRMLQGQTYANCSSCFCLKKGISRIFCYFQKNYYLPGQECVMICEADNTKCGMSISRIRCSFMKEVILTGVNGQTRTFTQNINTVYFPGVNAHSSYFGQNAQREAIKLVGKNPQGTLTPSTHGHYVICKYYILVQPMFSGFFTKVLNNQFKVQLTILQPAIGYDAIQKPSEWRPSIEQNANFYLNFDPTASNQINSMTNMTY